jgi:hypothetical protein
MIFKRLGGGEYFTFASRESCKSKEGINITHLVRNELIYFKLIDLLHTGDTMHFIQVI